MVEVVKTGSHHPRCLRIQGRESASGIWSRRELREKGTTLKDALDRRQHRLRLLAHGRQVAPDPPEPEGSPFAAEAAGNLLLDLQHPQVSLRQVVVERHPEVEQERQRLSLIPLQPQQQVAGRTLRPPPFLRTTARP